MKIPSRKEACRLLCDMEMLAHIQDHSLQVCSVALFLADRLKPSGIRLNRDLVESAALLHDITKTRSLATRENHAHTGGALLAAMGYHEVGDIVRQHVMLDDYDGGGPPAEAHIVNYADKRVLHDKVVSLEKRKAYILERYGTEPAARQRILHMWEKTEQLEHRIFDYLSFLPYDLGKLIETGY